MWQRPQLMPQWILEPGCWRRDTSECPQLGWEGQSSVILSLNVGLPTWLLDLRWGSSFAQRQLPGRFSSELSDRGYSWKLGKWVRVWAAHYTSSNYSKTAGCSGDWPDESSTSSNSCLSLVPLGKNTAFQEVLPLFLGLAWEGHRLRSVQLQNTRGGWGEGEST